MHPLLAISDPRAQSLDLGRTTFAIEGDPRARSAATALVTAMGGQPLALDAAAMPLYHAAAVLAANALVTLFDSATLALGAAGVPPDRAAQALGPLAEGAIAAAAARGAAAALTGPIARGDVQTVTGHLAALAARTPELVPIYVAVAGRTLALARRRAPASGSTPLHAWSRIEAILAEARRRQ
jgi:predicted short-subunit dehydrogenase-like oxidoreductase (DUF2520 family)